jgi:hypothetical protein
MAAQPDFNQLAQNYQGIANQISLFPNLPAIAYREAIWDEFRRRDEQAATRHDELVNLIQGLNTRFDRLELN